MTPQLEGMSHSGFETEDMVECLRWYTDVLGARVEWTRPRGADRPTSAKIYVGDLGLSIGERKKDAERIVTPGTIRWAYRAEPGQVLQYIDHIVESGVKVEGPKSDENEPSLVCWFFDDPDGHKIAIETKYASLEAAQAIAKGSKG
jgi:catechol 2,3-dioxygenase-like lactoylglutathione lyase family enzyme